jgi:hypothetical protein
MRYVFLIAALCALSPAVLAQGSECKSIRDPDTRLACYDRGATPPVGARASAMPPMRSQPSPKADASRNIESLDTNEDLVNARMNGICRGC